MKLGISYGAFDGLELLEYLLKTIRLKVDFICLVRQKTSYHGNPADPVDLETIDWLYSQGLADEIVDYDPDLSLHPQDNEVKIRNLGLDRSIAHGCTHHTSADVDEFYLADQLHSAKSLISDASFSLAESCDYFKKPTWKIIPERRYLIPFIHPVSTRYCKNLLFPYRVDVTRRPDSLEKVLVFNPKDIEIHHMAYVRNNIRKKMDNNMNYKSSKINQMRFSRLFDKYQLGGRLVIPPDFINRKTIEVENIFKIKESNGSIVSHRS